MSEEIKFLMLVSYFIIGIVASLWFLKTNNGSIMYQKESAHTDAIFILFSWPFYILYRFIQFLNKINVK